MSFDTVSDQVTLLTKMIKGNDSLSGENLMYAAWAAEISLKNQFVTNIVEQTLGKPSPEQLRDVKFAVARMGVTNPYFISRQFVSLSAGGTLEALGFQPLHQLKINNETAYHYACVVISLINGGHVCLRSHVSSLLNAHESDASIDASMRLAATCSSLARSQ